MKRAKQITVTEAMDRLNISRVRVLQLIQAGRIGASKVGRDWLIEETELNRFASLKREAGRPKKGKR